MNRLVFPLFLMVCVRGPVSVLAQPPEPPQVLQAGLERTQAAVSLRIAEADLAHALGRQEP
jgi:hypothetical protein